MSNGDRDRSHTEHSWNVQKTKSSVVLAVTEECFVCKRRFFIDALFEVIINDKEYTMCSVACYRSFSIRTD